MAFSNYLTQGQPLPSTSQAYTTSQVPQYLSDYLYNLLSGSYSAAQESYQPYQGPRVAGMDPMQTQAYQNLQQNVIGSWKPEMAQAQQAMGQGQSALQTAATMGSPDLVKQYMNPYQEQVMNRMGDLAQRQLQEKIMPAIGDQFIRAGQFGSSRQQEIAQRGARDTYESLLGQEAQLAQQGYQQATNAAQADLARKMQAGTALGQLGTQAAQLGAQQQRMGLQDVSALEAAGQAQQQLGQKNLDVAYQDFVNQRDYPKTQLQFLSNIVRGLPSGGGTTAASTQSTGQSYGMSPLQQLAAAGSGAAALSKLFGG